MEQTANNQPEKRMDNNSKKPTCGIIMPISSIENCSKEHWNEVKNILSEAITKANFNPCLVSDADDSGVIQKRIVQNLYDNDIVVCDVSCKNPNVMFELGMRLAFDKPTIIVMDNETNYSFDTSVIEHLSYPRNLSYYDIISFQTKLSAKITATINKSKDDPDYTTFLKHFGEFEVATIEKKKGSINDILLSRIDEISQQIRRMQKQKIGPTLLYSDQEINLRKIIQTEVDKFSAENNIKDIRMDEQLLKRIIEVLKMNGIDAPLDYVYKIFKETIM